MAEKGEGRPLHAYVIVHTSAHTILSVFSFTMFAAANVLCNASKIVSNWK